MLADPEAAPADDAAGGGGGGGGARRRGGRPKAEDAEDGGGPFARLAAQPPAVSGTPMRDYQLEGLNWLISCHANGISAILADEMGLGKTLQTIALLAWCKDQCAAAAAAAAAGAGAPATGDVLFLVLAPKSTLANWERECARFCPSLTTAVLIGTPEERAAIIEARLRPGTARGARRWDLLIASYEMASIEALALRRLPFYYLVVDEAHRLKNEGSLLACVVRDFTSAHRLLLTGTPLQNDLHELWALLNFLLPSVFADARHFDAWFERAAGSSDEDAKARMVSQLHGVLRPFMLRRLKVDVAKGLPPKKETLLYVRLTSKQR
jgi:SWI/SNF-related matrix-associated actin-dependent regulator of chromatin subfamily A member 5